MRVLSFQQPSAHLVVRGVQSVEIRSWAPKKPEGRIAIHASTRFEPTAAMEAWENDGETARCFAGQGWISRDDLRELPRSAVLGTVELVGVVHTSELRNRKRGSQTANAVARVLDSAVRDPVSGRLRPSMAPAHAMPIAIPREGFVWMFDHPLEIEPILDVQGQQHLWELPAEVAELLIEREARARSGAWRAPQPSRERRQAALDAWSERFETDIERQAERVAQEALYEMEMKLHQQATGPDEKRVRAMLRTVVGKRAVTNRDGSIEVKIEKRHQSLFGGRALVPIGEFELALRRAMHETQKRERLIQENLDRLEALEAALLELHARADRGEITKPAIEREAKIICKRLVLTDLQRHHDMQILGGFPELGEGA